MPTRTAIVASSIGLQARPATEFTRRAIASGIPISVGRADGTKVSGASVLAIMMLGIRCGEEVILSTEQPDSQGVLDDLVAFLETDHDISTASTL